MKRMFCFLFALCLTLIFQTSLVASLWGHAHAWAVSPEPNWDVLDKVTLKMLDKDNIVFTEDLYRRADYEVQYGFKASDAIDDLISFYWNDPAVVEILALNDYPLKDSRFKAWSGRIDPKLKGLKATLDPERIAAARASEERRKNFEVIDISIVTLRVNGKRLKPDVNPYIEHGRVMVPFRTLYESLKGKVHYDFTGNQRVWMRVDQGAGDYTELSMTVGDVTATKTVCHAGKNEVTQISMDVAPQLRSGRTFIPARYAAELLNLSVRWNSDIREVLISGSLPVTPSPLN